MSRYSNFSRHLRLLLLSLSLFAFSLQVLAAPGTSSSRSNRSKGSNQSYSTSTSDIAISTASVLLPPDPNTSFEISAFNGCFKWKEIRETSLVQLTELEPCGHRIRINVAENRKPIPSASSSSKTSGAPSDRLSTLLVAEDSITHRVLRCEVFVDRIEQIEILTTARSLYRDDIQELQVQAFDSQSNLFSSVEGLEFQWKLEPEGTSAGEEKNILKTIPFKDSGYEASEKLLEFESRGKQTGSILLQAMEIGRVRVSTRLVDMSVAANVESVSTSVSHAVSMSVVEPLELEPSKTLYVAPKTLINYKLLTYQRRQRKEIEMPSKTYFWTSSDPTVAFVLSKDNSVVTTTEKLGYATIEAVYDGMEDSIARGGVNVVTPMRLGLRLRPVGWIDEEAHSTYMIQNEEYLLEIDLYDSDGNRMDQFEGSLGFSLTFEQESHVRILGHPKQNQWIVSGLTLGRVSAHLSLTRVGHKSLGAPTGQTLSATVELEVTKRIQLAKSQIVLPLDHSFQVQATGGSTGRYVWTSSRPQNASVDNDGVVTVQLKAFSKSIHDTVLTCADERDPLFNRATATVVIAAPTAISFVAGEREAEVGSNLFVAVSLSAQNGELVFDNCTAVPIKVNLTVADVFLFDFESGALRLQNCEIGCGCVSLRAVKDGQTRMGAFLTEDTAAVATLAAYKPLTASPDFILVTLGSSFDVAVTGGPQPWQHQQLLTPVLTPDDQAAVTVELVPRGPSDSKFVSMFRLTCLTLGTYSVKVNVTNSASKFNPHPVHALRSVTFKCAEPAHVFLAPVIASREDAPESAPVGVLLPAHSNVQTCGEADVLPDLKDLHATLMSFSATGSSASDHIDPYAVLPSRFKLRNHRFTLLQLSLLDSVGHVFNNFSSVSVAWAATNPTLLSLNEAPNESQTKTHKLAKLAEKEGTASVRVTVTGYDSAALQGIVPKIPQFSPASLSRDFEFSLVHNVYTIPSKISLYNHPENRVRLFAVGGSGFAQAEVNDTEVASVVHSLGSSEITVTPIKPGVLKISLTDLCLAGSDSATALVYVSSVASVRVNARDMLKVGDHMSLHIELLDAYGGIFNSTQLRQWMDWKLHVEGTSLEMSETTNPAQYAAVGRHVGVSTLSVSVTDPTTGAVLVSSPLQVHVYPPLQVTPSSLVLIPGAQFQLTVSGGPPFRSAVSFESSNNTVASVSKDGFVSAMSSVGSALITVRVFTRATDSVAEKTLHAGSAFVDIEVRLLSGVRIAAPSTKMILGEEMVLRVEGPNRETPFSWGGLDVAFKWEVVNPDIVTLAPIFERSNVSLDEEHGFTVRAKAHSQGNTRIVVRVTNGPHLLASQSANFHIEVVPVLSLSANNKRTWAADGQRLLLAPGASIQLAAPKMPNNAVVFSVLPSSPCSASNSEAVPIVRLEDSSENSVVIHSAGVAGHAVLLAKDREQGQIALVNVAVKSVQLLELRPRAAATAGQLYSQAPFRLPVGNSYEFDIILRDELGQVFDSFLGSSASSVQFDVLVNRPDIVSVELTRANMSRLMFDDGLASPRSTPASGVAVRVKGLRPGKAILQVRILSAESELPVQMFQLIRVANAIVPASPVLHLGAEVKFNTTFAPDPAYKRVWSSSNEEVLFINATSGEAVALSVGKVAVYHNSSVFTATAVRVVKVEKVDAFDTSDCFKALSAPLQTHQCIVPIRCLSPDGSVLADAESTIEGSSKVIQQNLHIKCIGSHSAAISTTSSMTTWQGVTVPACMLSWKPGESPLSRDDRSVKLEVTVGDKDSSYAVKSQDIVVPVQFSAPTPIFNIQGPRVAQLDTANPSVKYSVDVSSGISFTVQARVEDPSRVVIKELASDSSRSRAFEVSIVGTSSLGPVHIDFVESTEGIRETMTIWFSGAQPAAPAPEPVHPSETPVQPVREPLPVVHGGVDFGLLVIGVLLLAGAFIGGYILLWNRKAAVVPAPLGAHRIGPMTPAQAPVSPSRAAALRMDAPSSIHMNRGVNLPPTPSRPGYSSPYRNM